MYTYDDVKDVLGEGVGVVTFRKVNGDMRKMRCTMDFSLIPETKWPKTLPGETDGLDRMIRAARVFDLDLEEWRSFRIENVTDMVVE